MSTPLERAHVRHALIRDLAAKSDTNAALARRYGVTRQGIGDFAKRYAVEIDQVRSDLENEFAGLWSAEKRNRIAAYQRDVELLDDEIERMTGPDIVLSNARQVTALCQLIKRKHAALRSVAEELGQLPSRVAVQITGGEQPVLHQIVGVDPDAL